MEAKDTLFGKRRKKRKERKNKKETKKERNKTNTSQALPIGTLLALETSYIGFAGSTGNVVNTNKPVVCTTPVSHGLAM